MINLIANTVLEKKAYEVLNSFFNDNKLLLVKIVHSEGKNSKLELYLDKLKGKLSVEDCALIAPEVSSLLEVEEMFTGGYRLEISSPGIDRSLTRIEDFSRYKNFDVKVVKSNSTLKGKLAGYSSKSVSIHNKNGVSDIEISEIKDIKLDIDKMSFEKIKKMESL